MDRRGCLCRKSHTITPISCGCYCHDTVYNIREEVIRKIIYNAYWPSANGKKNSKEAAKKILSWLDEHYEEKKKQ